MRDKELKQILNQIDKINDLNIEPLNMHANIERVSNQSLLMRERNKGEILVKKKNITQQLWHSKLFRLIAVAFVGVAIIAAVTGGIVGSHAIKPSNPIRNIGNIGGSGGGGGEGGDVEGYAVMYATGYSNLELGSEIPKFVILKDGQLGKVLYVWLPEGTVAEDWEYYRDVVLEGGAAPGWLKNGNYDGVLFFYGTQTIWGKNGKITFRVEQGAKGWCVIKSNGKIDEIIWGVQNK